MAQERTPASTSSRKRRCSSTGSGVVMPVVCSAPGRPTPKVPTSAHGASAGSCVFDSAQLIHQAVEVLPLVPVTASTCSAREGAPWYAAAIGPVSDFRFG